MWDWSYAADITPDLLRGLLLTFQITAMAFVVSVITGLVWAIAGRAPNRVVRGIVRLMLEFVRGTPLLVQLFLVYYVLPDYGIVLKASVTAVLVIGVHYSTYVAEAYRAGIESVPREQWEAARSLHLSPVRTWRAVVLPPAVRFAIPPIGSYLIQMYKETALLFAIGLPVLLAEARSAGGFSFRLLEPFTIAGLMYLAVSVPSSMLVSKLERRYDRAH